MKVLEKRQGTGCYLGQTIYLETEFTAKSTEDFRRFWRKNPDKVPKGRYVCLPDNSKEIIVKQEIQLRVL